MRTPSRQRSRIPACPQHGAFCTSTGHPKSQVRGAGWSPPGDPQQEQPRVPRSHSAAWDPSPTAARLPLPRPGAACPPLSRSPGSEPPGPGQGCWHRLALVPSALSPGSSACEVWARPKPVLDRKRSSPLPLLNRARHPARQPGPCPDLPLLWPNLQRRVGPAPRRGARLQALPQHQHGSGLSAMSLVRFWALCHGTGTVLGSLPWHWYGSGLSAAALVQVWALCRGTGMTPGSLPWPQGRRGLPVPWQRLCPQQGSPGHCTPGRAAGQHGLCRRCLAWAVKRVNE